MTDAILEHISPALPKACSFKQFRARQELIATALSFPMLTFWPSMPYSLKELSVPLIVSLSQVSLLCCLFITN